ncbi:uncharacterized calcium-binding protein C800.10c isoform X1 [Medicago truncatula]|uniref:uncharacterized calcium-binding protein C800.10c isoform X1 n=1 Tax=Medicago truncatula TaxID=3880 RepID=UPI000D2F359A|nr:uncharacterized calcium-binding protein C800.10c isoform X1 [Medicago truncatula]
MMAGGPLQPPHVGGTLPTASTQEGFGFAITSSASIVAPPTWPTQSKYPTSVNDGIVASDSFFRGGDLFSTTSSQPNQDSSPHGFSSAILHVSCWNTTSDSLQSSLATHSVRPYLQQNQHASVQAPNMHSSPGLPVRLQDSASGQPQPPWPRMTQTDKQKYTNIFMEVDKDRDGKITGEQARDLFLSWALPKDVLKQVCDLSDQDNDSMLSLNEFCIALHLMERHREGHALPAVLPNNILLDLPTSGQPANLLSPVTWGNQSGVQQQQMMTGSGAQHLNPTAGWPPRPAAVPPSDEGPQSKQQKSKIPVLEKHLTNQLSSDEQNSINLKFQEATEANKMVKYNSRCDNRLNETTERISADKHEVEILAKKYEDKYKQVGDVSSKLTTEEATFCDIQGKKFELYQWIVKLEQDVNTDDTVQVRADRINFVLDELVKSLNEQCKKYGLRAKLTTLLELPFGWQPGIQEGAADWDEDWDELEDKAEFALVKEYTLDVQNTIAHPNQKQPKAVSTKALDINSPKFVVSPKSDDKSEKPQTTNEQGVGNGSVFDKSNDGSEKSAPNSPFASSTIGRPHRDFVDSDIRKTSGENSSPRNQNDTQETQSDHGGEKSVFSEERVFDEPNWGTFDTNDDIDSVWGFNASSKEERELDGAGDNYFFSSGDLGLNRIKTSSPQAGDLFLKTSG